MSWRAFVIGLVLVAGLSLITLYNDSAILNTGLGNNHFPVGAFFLLVLLTLGVNTLLRLMRRVRALGQGELMLIWCMMIVASTVPSNGLLRNFFPLVASAPYYAKRADLQWEEVGHVLSEAPDELVLSKDVDSRAAAAFFDGTPRGQPVHIPWGEWVRPMAAWGCLVLFFFLPRSVRVDCFAGSGSMSSDLPFPWLACRLS